MTPRESAAVLRGICARTPVIPVMEIHDAGRARPLAEALLAGGLSVLEVTLRTPAAEAALREMAQVPGAVVGAGTLLTPCDVARAVEAGADFGVSPGATPRLIEAALDAGLPLLPGAVTPSEMMRLLEEGHDMLKFFPAAASGGASALAAIAAPLPQLAFCPTGGVTEANAPDYLALPNVLCVGGSWTAPRALVEAEDWPAIERLAHRAAGLAHRLRAG
ncbi:keto-deoxy-phosphogluconate aldolase [Maritimibacter sp. 55A14]|uniref:bifunctional 4-hydroxy-2-oxoglutarate aldolase/2-dehydro-3-deoxy-phosphogluconate aldolase n=1 Tax=Maritimibacter sp. 55A14 TaxID=2174844 RepID=UPI000D618BBE|nr:bifunctional 4-hydroxy-2-oxoglutarate aldolase/2-dehydro-3-deoxy-phosphogluconate aldolase [Maritimibacter sp. 55A14]PWE33214.1 keto-deoxy-phosphogluconate aldolase [Maritimibacter sp. 55A14]